MLPGVLDFLNELKDAGIRIGLGSSSKNSVLILEKLGILDFFSTIIDGNKIHMSKPHPEVFLRGAVELGLEPHEVVVFEDAISGVEAALSGGFKCIGIGEEKFLHQANAVVSSLQGMSVSRMQELLNS
jgi:beta-phosphoglucomutase